MTDFIYKIYTSANDGTKVYLGRKDTEKEANEWKSRLEKYAKSEGEQTPNIWVEAIDVDKEIYPKRLSPLPENIDELPGEESGIEEEWEWWCGDLPR